MKRKRQIPTLQAQTQKMHHQDVQRLIRSLLLMELERMMCTVALKVLKHLLYRLTTNSNIPTSTALALMCLEEAAKYKLSNVLAQSLGPSITRATCREPLCFPTAGRSSQVLQELQKQQLDSLRDASSAKQQLMVQAAVIPAICDSRWCMVWGVCLIYRRKRLIKPDVL